MTGTALDPLMLADELEGYARSRESEIGVDLWSLLVGAATTLRRQAERPRARPTRNAIYDALAQGGDTFVQADAIEALLDEHAEAGRPDRDALVDWLAERMDPYEPVEFLREIVDHILGEAG